MPACNARENTYTHTHIHQMRYNVMHHTLDTIHTYIQASDTIHISKSDEIHMYTHNIMYAHTLY